MITHRKPGTGIIKIDTTKPEVTKLEMVDSAKTTTSLTVKVTASDTLSGVASVAVSAQAGTETAKTQTLTNYSSTNNQVTITGLTSGKKYKITAVAVDMAGNTSSGDAGTTGLPNIMTATVLEPPKGSVAPDTGVRQGNVVRQRMV